MWPTSFLSRAHPGTVFGLWATQGHQDKNKLNIRLFNHKSKFSIKVMIIKFNHASQQPTLRSLSTGFPTNDPGGRRSRSLPRDCRRILCLLFHRCHQVEGLKMSNAFVEILMSQNAND